MRRVLIVIPAFNEAAALPALLAGLHAAARARSEELVPLVIDDGSSDGTSAAARAGGARVVRLGCNLGIGAAVQTGLRVARQEGFDGAVQVDGDGQHPPEQLARLLDRLAAPGAPDLIIGSRFVASSGERWQSSRARRLGIRWLSLALRAVAGARVLDPTSGFRAFGPRALELFARAFPTDFPEPESIALALGAGLRVDEEPVEMLPRRTGQSSIRGWVPAYYMLKVTLAVLLARLRQRAPRAKEQGWIPPSSAATGSSPRSAPLPRSASSASSPGSG